MPATDHRGVGLIATNAARTRFFVQRKDEHYVPGPRGFSFFGGACDEGESLREGLARELREELGPASASVLLAADPRSCWTGNVGPSGFAFTLFEVVLDDATLDRLAAAPVFEGERGAVLSRQELATLPFIWGLTAVIADYLHNTP